MPRQRRLFTIDTEILQALYEYSHQSGDRLDALYDEALRDLLKKKGQPVTLKEALQQSARRRRHRKPPKLPAAHFGGSPGVEKH